MPDLSSIRSFVVEAIRAACGDDPEPIADAAMAGMEQGMRARAASVESLHLGPSYMRVSAEPAREGESMRQIHASDTVIVDVADDGRVLGIECLDGLVGPSAMLAALQAIRVAGEAPPAEPELPASHPYLSTACVHAQILEDEGDDDQARTIHGRCGCRQRERGDASVPHCKFCSVPCSCPCHVATGEAS